METTPGNTKLQKGKYRALSGPAKFIENIIFYALILGGVFWILELYRYIGVMPMGKQYVGGFLGFALAGVFISVPYKRGRGGDSVPWFDWILAGLSLVIGFYIIIFYPSIMYRLNLETPLRIALGAVAVLLVFEALRRVIGWIMVGIAGFFMVYAPLAGYFPGILEGKFMPVDQLLNYIYLDSNALLGIPLTVAATIILAFILLGHALSVTGGAQFFMDLAMAIMGRFRGGPAKMSVAASSLFGTISGAAVANVVTTGIITIPLMKKNGFKSEMAGAIETSASTGGQLMPPVMGAAAFLIAEMLAIPYLEVVVAALIPALLYYITLFVQIDLEAAKFNIKGLPASDLPRLGRVLKGGIVAVIPLAMLIFLMFVLNYRPDKAGMYSVITLLVLALLNRRTRLNLKMMHRIIVFSGRGMLELAAICGAAGIVIGVLNVSGLGFGLSLALVNSLGQNILLLLLFSAVICIILGMGMPTVAVYILLAVLVAPALIELGIEPLAAHLFIFYFGMMSMVTPPICIAAFAAAAVAESDPMKTGIAAFRLSIIALIVPFLFVLEPSLLLMGKPAQLVYTGLTAVCGCFFLGVGLTGYFLQAINILGRIMAIGGGVFLLIPAGIGLNLGWGSDFIGFLLLAGLTLWQLWKKQKNLKENKVYTNE
ncbi:MAG: TRAP transporter fused permease subunit [Desulfobacteraceae bacterium]|nr:TRAP transporter fused permease subunit [Desulfobacteraceae bacterium]